MRVTQGRPPTSWIKLQLTEYYGQRYIQSRSWTVRNIQWGTMVDKVTRMLGIRWHSEKPTVETVVEGQKPC